MRRFVALTLFCVVYVAAVIAQTQDERDTPAFDSEHTEWIANSLLSIQTVKAGMTRADLMKVFTTEGGLEFFGATTRQQTYVYRKCPYIKVDVKFEASGPVEYLPGDKIISISRPYLAWSVMD